MQLLLLRQVDECEQSPAILCCCPGRGRAKAQGKGAFLVPERGKIAKRRQSNAWLCSEQGVTSRVGRRVASPHPRPLCTAEGIIYPHFPTFFLLTRAITDPTVFRGYPRAKPHPGQPLEPGAVGNGTKANTSPASVNLPSQQPGGTSRKPPLRAIH